MPPAPVLACEGDVAPDVAAANETPKAVMVAPEAEVVVPEDSEPVEDGRDDVAARADDEEAAPPKEDDEQLDDAAKLAAIHEAVPDSTPAERRRFLDDRDGDVDAAIEKLKTYLAWRADNRDEDLVHLDSWNYATQTAVRSMYKNKEGGEEVDIVAEAAKIPQVIFVHEDADTGKRHYQLLVGRLDPSIVPIETYTDAVALYIDHVLDRTDLTRYSIALDLRAGHGWANIPAVQNLHLIPFLSAHARTLQDMFPHRIDSIVIFPVPAPLKYIFVMFKPFLASDTALRLHLVYGWGVGKDSAPPEELKEHVGEGTVEAFEETRRGTFTFDDEEKKGWFS